MRNQKAATAQMVEAIMLFDEKGIVAEMLYPEFQALLDNIVCLPRYADEQVRAAYVVINPRLLVRSLVFFNLDFDEQGHVDPGWNIDLQHLSDAADTGPDLGAGPISLACRSQCPVPWYQMYLWDPEHSIGKNHFRMIRDAVAKNTLGLTIEEVDVVVRPQSLQVAAEERWVEPGLRDAKQQQDAVAKEQRKKAALLIKQQKLQLKAKEAEYTDAVAKLRHKYEQVITASKAKERQLQQQVEQLQQQNAQLKAQWAHHAEKIKEIQANVQKRIRTMSVKEQQQMEELKAQYEAELQIQLENVKASYQDKLSLLEAELSSVSAELQQMKEARILQQKAAPDQASQSVDTILQNLHDAGINFVALHPGAGHIDVALKDIHAYVENPIAYAAKHCLVTEEQYLEWLKHYESASCDAVLASTGKRCDLPLDRKNHPSKYVSGITNRCSRHRELVREN